jgi:hypothetical protein
MQTPINPKGFTNQNTINNMFGEANPGTFTRTVGQPSVTAPTDPLTGLPIDPLANQSPDAPVPPPVGVKSNITPPYGLNTY